MNVGETTDRLRAGGAEAIPRRVRASVADGTPIVRAILVALLFLLASALVLGGVPPGDAGVAAAQEQQQDREATPEGPPEHEHPDEVNDPADLASLQRWFGGRMGEAHVDCSEGLAVGDFDACEDLDGEYESYLERYVTVERETTANESEREGDDFGETRRQQSELAERLREFNETYEEYQQAREVGDEASARERARELRRLADRIDELGGDLQVRFRELDDATDADLERAANRTEETTEEVRTITLAVERETFVGAELTLRSDATASFASPATVTGTLRTENGTAIPNAGVVIADDADYRATATTDENGTFEATYRPKLTGVGETELTAVYVPDERSSYLGVNATTTVDVEPTNTSLDVGEATETAAFGDEVRASGTLSAAGDRPSGVPVRLVVGGETLAVDRTDGDGAFAVAATLPAAVPAGDATLEVGASEPGAALSADAATRSLAVEPTETALSATVEYGDGEAHVEGRLETADGVPVAGQPVTLTAGSETHTATTDEAGRYGFVIDRPANDREAVVVYEGADVNLDSSRAQVAIESPADGGAAGTVGRVSGASATLWSLVVDNPVLAALAGAVVLANLAIGVAVAMRRRRAGADADAGVEPSASTFEGTEPAISRVSDERSGLDAARTYLESAPSTAVQLAYTSVRSALTNDDSSTHWEVYREAKGQLDEDRRESLRAVVEAFEAATFAPEGVDRERATRALEDAERCLTAPDGGERPDAAESVPRAGDP